MPSPSQFHSLHDSSQMPRPECASPCGQALGCCFPLSWNDFLIMSPGGQHTAPTPWFFSPSQCLTEIIQSIGKTFKRSGPRHFPPRCTPTVLHLWAETHLAAQDSAPPWESMNHWEMQEIPVGSSNHKAESNSLGDSCRIILAKNIPDGMQWITRKHITKPR